MSAKDKAWQVYTVARQDFRRACEGAIRAEPGKRAERAALRLASTRTGLDAATLAYAAACVAEALADPLALLEALAKIGTCPVGQAVWAETGVGALYGSVSASNLNTGCGYSLQYWRTDEDGKEYKITRAEAAALLGKEKGDDA